jgi:glucuronosyltransferase
MLVHLNLAGELASRGHDVYFLTPDCHQDFAEKVVKQNHPNAQLNYVSYYLNCEWVEHDKQRAAVANPVHGIWMILEALANRTDSIMSNTTLIAELQALAPNIDIMVADLMAYSGLLAVQLGIPHIDFDVGTAGSLFEPRFYGAQAVPAYVPAVGTFFPTNGMSFTQRAVNMLVTTGARTLLDLVYRHPSLWVQKMISKHGLNVSFPYLNPLLLLVNSNFILEPPRPVAPQTKYIGPILPNPPKALPEDLEAWLQGSSGLGVVYISFGGTLQAPLKASKTIIAAIQSLPEVRFIWKLTSAERNSLAAELAPLGNLMVREWVPQNDLLGHPKLRAFVTQGGYLSIAESAYHGVPIVGLPLIAGQGELIQYAADQGRGVLLHKDTLIKGQVEKLRIALRRVLEEPSYALEAKKASVRLQAAPHAYRLQAAEMVEYAVRVKAHGPFLFTQGQKMAWYQILMLDVAVAVAVAVIVVSWLVNRAWRSRGATQNDLQGKMVAAEILLKQAAKKGA